jgi:hypothetical protein
MNSRFGVAVAPDFPLDLPHSPSVPVKQSFCVREAAMND